MTYDEHDEHDDFGGLGRDLTGLLGRRRALALLGGAGLAGVLAACGSGGNSATTTAAGASSTTAAPSTTTGTAAGAPAGRPGGAPPSGMGGPSGSGSIDDAEGEIPSETNGPYPADGTNGPNILTTEGIVRADITTSIGDLSGTATGVPLTMTYTVLDNATSEPLAGRAFYLWHCTATGKYSIYEDTDENYLRGIQVTDAEGKVTFTSIYPGCYPGRWPHTHFEVYESLDTATSGSQALKISQLAFPQAECETVYASDNYGDSMTNLGNVSLSSDNVFSDGYEDQLATISGDPTTGYTASLEVRI